MTGKQFKSIITRLPFTVILTPYSKFNLSGIIHMHVAWKYHMKNVLVDKLPVLIQQLRNIM